MVFIIVLSVLSTYQHENGGFGGLYHEFAYQGPCLKSTEIAIEYIFGLKNKPSPDLLFIKNTVIDDNYLKECYDFIMFPTTTCNARCFYCYENPMKKMPMTIDMAERVARYIMKKAPDKNRTVGLRWFGGEPLFNMKVIDYICEGLTENGIYFNSYFTTNGYLFDDDVIQKAIEIWHCVSCQITIDGTEGTPVADYVYNSFDYRDIEATNITFNTTYAVATSGGHGCTYMVRNGICYVNMDIRMIANGKICTLSKPLMSVINIPMTVFMHNLTGEVEAVNNGILMVNSDGTVTTLGALGNESRYMINFSYPIM